MRCRLALIFIFSVAACGQGSKLKTLPVDNRSGESTTALDPSKKVSALTADESQVLCADIVKAVITPAKKLGCLALGMAGGPQIQICENCLATYNESQTTQSTCSTTSLKFNQATCDVTVAQFQACTKILSERVQALTNTNCGSDLVAAKVDAPSECTNMPGTCYALAQGNAFAAQ
jgi:hypothetical protein